MPVEPTNFTGIFFVLRFYEKQCYNVPMENINLEIQRQVEERIRIQRIKNLTRACKDKLYEDAKKGRKNG